MKRSLKDVENNSSETSVTGILLGTTDQNYNMILNHRIQLIPCLKKSL